MPVLVYKCSKCNHVFDEFYHKFTEEIPNCPKCLEKKDVKRTLTKPAENPFGTVEGWFKFS